MLTGEVEPRPLPPDAFVVAQVSSVVKVFPEHNVVDSAGPFSAGLARNETEDIQLAVRAGRSCSVRMDVTPLDATDRWAENRHVTMPNKAVGRDVRTLYRKTAALALWNGPLLLAKSRRLGMGTEQLEDSASVIGKGYRPVLKRIESDRVMAAWDVRLVKEGEPEVTAKACDYQSAADARLGNSFPWFTIWF